MSLPFRKLLVANRGEIAVRILSTCRRLGLRTVAVYSDADASAPHVRMADEAVRIGAAPVRDSYLDIEALVAALRTTGADAVVPGYGLLSENADFARAVRGQGAVFVGPPASALAAFGDKIRARAVARAVGVLPPPGTAEAVDPGDLELVRALAAEVGYPLLVKAAGGGGGIGMQLVAAPEELDRALKTCADRGRAAFGDARVYLERYLERPRHIEVQVLCDRSGATIALGERECSVQRRHQKVIEEAPSPAAFLDADERRERLAAAACNIVRHVGYEGVGTVEFVADGQGQTYFLEVNARLQVEHPVTELVFGLDLVEQQLRVAAGLSISDPVRSLAPRGHAIEARLYAEDPEKGFIPQPGRIEALTWPEGHPGVRVDTGVEAGLDVTPYYDPLIAKVIAHAENRDEARKRLDAALAETQISLVGPKGPKKTNLELLRRVLSDERFVTGDYDTGLLTEMMKGQ